MRLTRLALRDFRTYPRLDLDLPAGPVLFIGDNAQGKTNLLEAVYLLASARSLRGSSELELIRNEALAEPLAAARVVGNAMRAEGPVQVEVVVGRRQTSSESSQASKRLKVNGVPARASGVVGRILAVAFTSLDLDLAVGAPSVRRRALDVALCQVEPGYLRALQRYTRIVQQRNSLLRHIAGGSTDDATLEVWNEELIEHGATLMSARARAVSWLSEAAIGVYSHLGSGTDALDMVYVPALGGHMDIAGLSEAPTARDQLKAAVARVRRREVAAGVTLAGPHRDDVALTLDGMSVASYGSRAQQRTAALAWRLAEARLLEDRSGEQPILLLDDILSELDSSRRRAVLETVHEAPQSLITAADLDRFPPDFLASASVFQVRRGAVERMDLER